MPAVEMHTCGECGAKYVGARGDRSRLRLVAEPTVALAWLPGLGYPADRKCHTCGGELPLAPRPAIAVARWVWDDPPSRHYHDPRPGSRIRLTRTDAAQFTSCDGELIVDIGGEILALALIGAEFVAQPLAIAERSEIDLVVLDLAGWRRSRRPERDGTPINILEHRSAASLEADRRAAAIRLLVARDR